MIEFIKKTIEENKALKDIRTILGEVCYNENRIFLQGGFLRDTISHKINKIPPEELITDFDFALEGHVWNLEDKLDRYGSVEKNSFGGMKWIPTLYPNVKVDLWFINNFWNLRDKPYQSTIYDLFNGVDFTFNQIAFDLFNEQLICDSEAISSIEEKSIKLVSTDEWANKEVLFVRIKYFTDKLQFKLTQSCIDFYIQQRTQLDWNIIKKYCLRKGLNYNAVLNFAYQLETNSQRHLKKA